jgi:hypothetical protein
MHTPAILTRADGTPIAKPDPASYASAVEYMRAFHAYKDEIARVANSAFDNAWRRSL